MRTSAIICAATLCIFSTLGTASAQNSLLLEGVELLDPSLSVAVLASLAGGGCGAPQVEQWSWNMAEMMCSITNGAEPYGDSIAADGSLIRWVNDYQFDAGCPYASSSIRFLVRRPGGTWTEAFRMITERRSNCFPSGCSTHLQSSNQTQFDSVNGILVIHRHVSIQDCQSGQILTQDSGVFAVSGFPRLFDTLLTFTPSGQSLSLLTPALPDGFHAADSLQVWTGNVRSLPDWSQARPLTCNAASNPTAGQSVTILDTLPAPPVGGGRYYISASQHGSDRRLGRQFVNGAFSARDPGALPVCGPQLSVDVDRRALRIDD